LCLPCKQQTARKTTGGKTSLLAKKMRQTTARKSSVASKGIKKVVATKVAKTTVKHKRPAKRGAVALRCVLQSLLHQGQGQAAAVRRRRCVLFIPLAGGKQRVQHACLLSALLFSTLCGLVD
jgi:hypothetical protein